MDTLPKLLRSTARIRFQDCDPYNHLNNANYIDYFMNAREDQVLEAYDIDVYKRARETGLAWLVVSNQLAYFQPANLMEVVTITSKIIVIGPRSMVIEFQMLNSKTEQVKAIMWTKLANVDIRSGKSTPHSEELMTRLSDVVVQVDEQSFEARATATRKSS